MKTAMSTFVRWMKFNMVGAMGMAVQLVTLALLNRWTGGHYLFASAVAVEFAVVHNFVWHLHFTWPDRRGSSADGGAVCAVSSGERDGFIGGECGADALLVGNAHLPVLVADSIAILCCSIVNFCLGDNWAFAARTRAA